MFGGKLNVLQQRIADLPDGPIRYLDAGEGPPLILLHGGGLDSAELSWGHLIPRLAEDFRVLAPNWPGYGGSAWSEQRRTTQGLIDCLGQLLVHWSVPTAAFAGISMGGGVALGLALSQPSRVHRLILVGTYGLQSHAPMHKLGYLVVHTPGMIAFSWSLLRSSRTLTRLALRRIMHQRSALTDDLLSQCHASVREPAAGKAFLAWQRSELLWNRLRTCYTDTVHELSVPILIIHGAEDPLVPLDAVVRAAGDLPNGALTVFEKTGHWPQRERPEEFLTHAIEFFRADREIPDIVQKRMEYERRGLNALYFV